MVPLLETDLSYSRVKKQLRRRQSSRPSPKTGAAPNQTPQPDNTEPEHKQMVGAGRLARQISEAPRRLACLLKGKQRQNTPPPPTPNLLHRTPGPCAHPPPHPSN